MNALRFATITMALTAAIHGVSCFGPEIADCAIPTLTERASDGGPDPCHCDPPPSLNLAACGCLSGPQGFIDAYNACMVLYWAQVDAGAD